MPGAATVDVAGNDPTAPTAIIEGHGITKRWRSTPVLTDAEITIGPGVTGLLGPNGAGKTTLIGMILGLHRPDGGSLRVLGLDPVTAGHEVRARVGYSPEHHRLPPDTRVADFVAHIAQVHGLPRRAAINRASDALWHVGLGEERFRPLGTMSTGQRQRAKLAQAIVHDPALVLLDEPTDGLDPLQRDDMLDLIRRLGESFGMHVVLSSHLLEEVERVCDDVVILRDGQVAASGPIETVRGSGSGIRVELVDGWDAVAAELAGRGLRVDRDGLSLVIRSAPGMTDPDAVFDAVRDSVCATGAAIRRLAVHRTTLEDVFLAEEGRSA